MSGECNVCGENGCVEMRHEWRVSYVYEFPGPAGPFKGKMNIKGDRPRKGDSIYGPFGSARITSVKEVVNG